MTELLVAGERDPNHRLCGATAAAIGVTGAGVVLVTGGRTLGCICASDAMTEAAEEVQFTLGEGPCVDAVRTQRPVSAPDLAGSQSNRWPGFREGAMTAGVRAAFGFPILIETVCVGAVDLYNDRPGPLTDEQYADSLAAAYVASRAVLGWQSVAGRGSLAWQLEHVPKHRAVVQQAAGMVSVQAEVSVSDAIAMLRAYSFATDRAISSVAEQIVARRLRLDGMTDPPES